MVWLSLVKIGLNLSFQKKILEKFVLILSVLCKIGWKWMVKKQLVALEINKNVFGENVEKWEPKLGFKVSRKKNFVGF